jgi:hypothetical protein
MSSVTPCLREHGNELRPHLHYEHDGHQKPRLQLRYLLARGQAPSRQDVAQRLGGHRHTSGRWLAI